MDQLSGHFEMSVLVLKRARKTGGAILELIQEKEPRDVTLKLMPTLDTAMPVRDSSPDSTPQISKNAIQLSQPISSRDIHFARFADFADSASFTDFADGVGSSWRYNLQALSASLPKSVPMQEGLLLTGLPFHRDPESRAQDTEPRWHFVAIPQSLERVHVQVMKGSADFEASSFPDVEPPSPLPPPPPP